MRHTPKLAMKTIKFTVALLLSIAAAPAVAQNTQKTVDLNPVVVTGTGTFRKAENSPVAVKVISAQELKNANVSNLQDALQQLTTNITTQTNGMGTFINFNGVSDDYLLILENGKRVSGDDRLARISLDNIKRIEILSGAASALYGSDAIAGVINIITDESRDKVSATSSTRVSSKNRLNQDINVDVTQGQFSSYTSYNYRQADNWQVNKYQEFQEGDSSVLKLTGRPMSQGYKSHNISERMEWRFSENFNVYLRGNLYDYVTNRPQGAVYFTQKTTTDKKTGEKSYSYTEKAAYTYDIHHKSYNYGAGARWVPTKNTHIYLDLYSDNFTSKYDYWQTAEKETYDETRKQTHYYNEALKGIFRLTDWNKLSGGIELEQESLNSKSDNIDNESTNTYNAFIQDEIQIVGGLEAVIGGRYTYNSNFNSHFTPNVALFYVLPLGDKAGSLRFRVSYAGGFRRPTLSQLYATDQAKTTARYTLNNTQLRPETNNFWNANIEYGTNWFNLSVSGYINKIRNMINFRTMTADEIAADPHLKELYDEGWTTIRQRDNIDRATLKGISANVKLLLPYGFTIGGGYSFTDSKAETMSLDTKTQQYSVVETPVDKSVKNVGNVNASWDYSSTLRNGNGYHLNITINGHIQGERYSSTYGFADGYAQWDLNTRHTITMKRCIVEPGIGIENIFNKRDTAPWNSNYSTINPGRAVVGTFKLKF